MLVAIGCGQSAIAPQPIAPPRLRYVGTGLVQESFPLVFALKLANEGEVGEVSVHEVRLHIEYRTLLYDDDFAGTVPPGFDCFIGMFDDSPGPDGMARLARPGNTTSIASGKTINVRGLVRWNVPLNAPPMLAIVRGRFVAYGKGKRWRLPGR